MHVHVGETRYQKLPATVDSYCRDGHAHLLGGSHRDDPITLHHHRLSFQYALAIHRNHRHIRERGDGLLRVSWRSKCSTTNRTNRGECNALNTPSDFSLHSSPSSLSSTTTIRPSSPCSVLWKA